MDTAREFKLKRLMQLKERRGEVILTSSVSSAPLDQAIKTALRKLSFRSKQNVSGLK